MRAARSGMQRKEEKDEDRRHTDQTSPHPIVGRPGEWPDELDLEHMPLWVDIWYQPVQDVGHTEAPGSIRNA